MLFFGDRTPQNHHNLTFMVAKSIFPVNVPAIDEKNGFKLLQLPYTDKRFSMVFLLPKKKFTLNKLERELSGRKFWNLVSGANPVEVEVSFGFFSFWVHIIPVKICFIAFLG